MAHRRRGHDERRRSSEDEDESPGRDGDREERDEGRRRRRERDERRPRDRDGDYRERRHRRSPDEDGERRGGSGSGGGGRAGGAVGAGPPLAALSDWYCRCGALNFKRRNTCYRQYCVATRAEAAGPATGGAGITKRLALGGLDTRSGEESIVRALQASAPAAAARLAGVALAPARGTCYLTFQTVADAMDAYGALLAARLRVNGRKVTVAYHPETWSAGGGAPPAPPPPPPTTPAFGAADVPRLAAYGAQLYATTPQERAHYQRYYAAYYARQLAAQPSEADRVNAAAAVAHSAISQLQARGAPAFVEERVYPTPDTSIYVYDDSSGYYYDPSTGLYYDANSQYYYDSRAGRYLYWNAAKMTYSPAAAAHGAAAAAAAGAPAADAPPPKEEPAEEGKRGAEKQDRIKVAKKIAKDMERWAKTLNQKKESARGAASAEAAEAAAGAASSGSADIGFTVLEARGPPAAAGAPAAGGASAAAAPALVPSYGAGSDSSGGEEEDAVVDWAKLACLLCKRRLPSREALEKHLRLSELHRRNAEEHERARGARAEGGGPAYRDRAAERRLKHGEDDGPAPAGAGRRRDAGAPPPPAPPTPAGEIGEDNIGNRLLQKMGWSAGQGLGREGQGRVGPLEARAGPPGAGLGQKRGIYTAGPGETYRDCVKKLMIARYQDLVENEANS